MNIKKTSIKTKNNAESLNVRNPVKCEIILPEYYDSIGKILKCSVNPSVESVNISDGKISISGSVLFSLLYTGENKKLYVFEAEEKYTKPVSCQNVRNDDCVFIDQICHSVNYRASGPRRAEINADIISDIRIERLECSDAVCDSDSGCIQLHKNKCSVFAPSAVACRDATIDTVADINNLTGSIECFIRKYADVVVTEVSAAENKLCVRGRINTELIYKHGNDEKIGCGQFCSDFSEIIDVFDVKPGDISFVDAETLNVYVNVKNTAGSTAAADIAVKVRFRIYSGCNTEFIYADDAFSVKGGTDNTFTELNLIKNCTENIRNLKVAFELDDYNKDSSEICCCYADNINITGDKRNNNEEFIVISAVYNVLIFSENSGYSFISRNYISEHKTDEILNGSVDKRISCQSVKINASQYSENKIHIDAEYTIKELKSEHCKDNILVGIEEKSDTDTTDVQNIVLYFAENGETIWNIAKENRCSVDTIKNFNDISDEVLMQDDILILPNF